MTNANPQQTIVRDLAYKANNPPNVNRVTDNINSFILFIFLLFNRKECKPLIQRSLYLSAGYPYQYF